MWVISSQHKKKSEKSKKKSLPSHNLKIAKNNNHNNKNLVLTEK